MIWINFFCTIKCIKILDQNNKMSIYFDIKKNYIIRGNERFYLFDRRPNKMLTNKT